MFSFLKNKFIITFIAFIIYSLFLDENDVFKIQENKRKLNELSELENLNRSKLNETKTLLSELKKIDNIEHYARSKKFYKKEDEDIFIITFE